jgi:hypothetical protein
LVEAITDLVLRELAEAEVSPLAHSSLSAPKSEPARESGSKVLVALGPGRADDGLWSPLTQAKALNPCALVWNGGRQDQLPGVCSGWKLEARTTNWPQVVTGYQAVVLLGCDISILASIANLGAGTAAPAQVAVAALASGLPVFMDNNPYEAFRRRSSRLASGFVRRFDEVYRMVGSFGVEFGGTAELPRFLGRLGETGAPPISARSGGRDVVTVEDVEAVRRSGDKRLGLAMGTIVTPLAVQRAAEWGIEVVFQ